MIEKLDTIPDVLNWIVYATVDDTKKHVKNASTATLFKALVMVSGKGKKDAIRREMFSRLEVGDEVCTVSGKSDIVKEVKGKCIKLENAPGLWSWKDFCGYGVPF